jgi:hypothetical protein
MYGTVDVPIEYSPIKESSRSGDIEKRKNEWKADIPSNNKTGYRIQTKIQKFKMNWRKRHLKLTLMSAIKLQTDFKLEA